MTLKNLNFKKIFVDKNKELQPYSRIRVQEVLNKFPDAQVEEVESHWRIPFFDAVNPEYWNKHKRNYLVLGVLKGRVPWFSGRSTDFIRGTANGCLSSCIYCYVNRRKGNANPLTIYMNDDQIRNDMVRHISKLDKKEPNQTHPHLWTYDIGCDSDVSLDALINDSPLKTIEMFANQDRAMASFATKTVNPIWKTIDPKGKTRIRYSLMPQEVSKLVDVNTSPISARIDDINELVDAGYEVHVNFSPVILTEPSSEYGARWKNLFAEIDDKLHARAKAQLKCEVIMLTHSKSAHEINKRWHPQGEQLIWQPHLQREKYNKPGVICYQYDLKARVVDCFTKLINKYLPYCQVRYAF